MKTVLCVEDNADILGIIKLALKDLMVLQVKDGRKVIKLCAKRLPDLVLMDLNMPGLNGFQLIKMLRKAGYKRPILVLTASDSPENREKAKLAGCTDYILKTLDMKDLREAVNRHLKY